MNIHISRQVGSNAIFQSALKSTSPKPKSSKNWFVLVKIAQSNRKKSSEMLPGLSLSKKCFGTDRFLLNRCCTIFRNYDVHSCGVFTQHALVQR